MRYLLMIAVWIGTAMSVVPVGAAVDFRTGVNRDTITVGDPVVFRMRIVRLADDQVRLAQEDSFPKPFELRNTQKPEVKALENGQVQETRDLTLTIYQVGAFDIPSVVLHYVTAQGDSGAIQSQPIPVVVRSVKPEGTKDIRDVKPPMDVEAKVPLWAWGTLAGLLLLVAGIIWWWRRRSRKPQVVPLPPPVDWEKELKKVGQLGLLEKRDYKPYYSLMSEVLRRCLEAKTEVHAVERTTYEIAGDLRAANVNDDLIVKIVRFLTEADMVKFAKYTPTDAVAQDAFPLALDIVKTVVAVPVKQGVTNQEGRTP